ncbi:MAG: ATP-binding cassette domain-containing protein [Rhizobiales bacterium]|nr:ATP-binding cassette domain-containing protein [Hyphomicrobiales bacterium]
MTHVVIEKLAMRYEGQRAAAVNGIDMELAPGRLTALLGPSGCGKTTTMKLIAGLLRPDGGDIRFDGESVLPLAAERRDCAMVFQKPLLFPYMSVGENVAFGLRQRGIDRATRTRKVREMLALVQLEGFEDRRPGALSGGQQQRVALARALVIEPRVLLLDEPLSALDAHLREEMRELICSIQRRMGITTLVVTHDQDEAVVLADTIAVMFDGDIHQMDAPHIFYERPASSRIARFFGARNLWPARITGGMASTDFGRLAVEQGEVREGSAILTIRPGEVALGDGPNAFDATVTARIYLGEHVRARFDLYGTTLEGLFPRNASGNLVVGARVRVRLPAGAIWTMTSQ